MSSPLVIQLIIMREALGGLQKTICFLGFLIWQNRLIQFHILSIPLVNKIRYLSKIAVFFATRKINFFVLSHRLQEHG